MATEPQPIDGPVLTPSDQALVGAEFPHKSMSPEEFVARHSHGIGCFSLDRHHYDDPDLDQWMKRVGELLRNPEATDQCRRKLLSAEEYQAVQEALADIREHGL
jgi:hypothetical protein